MARVIISTSDKKRVSREGKHVNAIVGVVSGTEYYELSINAYDQNEEAAGLIVVTKISSKDVKPKEVYRVPARTKVRKASSEKSGGTTSGENTEE